MSGPTPEPPPTRAEHRGPPRVPSGDLLAVAGLIVGSLVLPVVGWLVGLILLWRSSTWTRAEKLIGTAVWPGGLLPPLALPLLPAARGCCAPPPWR